MSDFVEFTCAHDVATITLNRPERRNALNQAMWAGLRDAARRADALPEAKIVVVRGTGGHFAAGADISEFDTVYASRERAAAYAATVAESVAALANAAKPVIAMIEGSCIGGGMGIALGCDLRIAASDAKFGITPAKLGLVYSLADTKRLVDAVGPSSAKDILFTGRIMDSREALTIGLIDETVAPEMLEAAVAAKCEAIASASQWSVRKAKEIVRLIVSGTTAESPATGSWFIDATEGADFREGRKAFMEKRKPEFPFR